MGENCEVYVRINGWADKVGDIYLNDSTILPETFEIMKEDGTVIAYVKEHK